MLPAKEVSMVLPFLVNRFFRDNENEVPKDIEGFFSFFPFSLSALSACNSCWYSSSVIGLESSVSLPSNTRMIREEYCSANSGLCVTMIIKRPFEISLRISITWMLVSVSNAPVGSSAKIISGLLTNARAIATRCICPPDISLGFLESWLPNPTSSSAFFARFRRSALDTPDNVNASSTFCRTVWWGIKL